jgi:tetratricopeptide (TPR) repeat protein
MKKLPDLTRRERDVLLALCRPLARGAAFTEPASIHGVADALGVSEAAVKQHLTHLYDKFGIFEGDERRRVRLANLALSEGAVPREDLDGAPREPAADPLVEGRAAVALRNWPRAYEQLARAGQAGAALSPDDLENLGEAAIWVGRHDESVAARQRAHALHVRDGNVVRAAAVGLALVINHVARLNLAQASGWFAKAKRHLEAEPPGAVHGYLAATESLFMLAGGDIEGGLEQARKAFAAGERFRDPDLHALGLVFQGYALAQLGRMAEATPLFDEAMASATSGELGPLATGLVYCRTICACLDAFDYRRAREWTEAIDHVAADGCTAGFPGDCRAHRASLLAVRGDWARAESEARTACTESERFDLAHTGLANYEIGQVRLRSGDLEAAAAAFQRAHELGMSPQPGLALLHLERGDTEAATASIRSAVEETAPESLRRARLLQAQVEIAGAASDARTACVAAGELARIAEAHASTALKASAESALGVASLAEGKPSAALGRLRHACRLWLEVDAPYDVARIRIHVAAALRALDDEGSAVLELEAARAAFERLGARPDAARAVRVLTELRRPEPG